MKLFNFFDTANTNTDGLSETFLGELVGQDREQIVIATKVAYTGGSSAENIVRQFDENRSLEETGAIRYNTPIFVGSLVPLLFNRK